MKFVCVQLHLRLGQLLKKEDGQVLVITLAILGLGALIVGPFLTHAGTVSFSSQKYGQTIKETYSAAAGVEHGIWNLVYSTLAQQIPNQGNQTTYSLPNQVNSLTPVITVTHTVAGGGVPLGTITKAITGTLQFSTQAYNPDIINISGNYYVIAYRGSTNKGYLSTLSIASDGTISNTTIDSYIFESTACYEPSIVQVYNGIFAIAYRGPNNDGYLKTVQINSNGTINKSVIDSLIFDSAQTYEPEILTITSGSSYVIAYRGASNYGYLTTVAISSTGVINHTIIDQYAFVNSVAYLPKIIYTGNSKYAIVYRDSSNRGNLTTISISAIGAITHAITDSYMFDSNACYEPDILYLGTTSYAITYRGNKNVGQLITLPISSAGLITHSLTDSFIFDSKSGYEPDIINVAGTIYAIAYRGNKNVGQVITLPISNTGVITHSLTDSYTYDSVAGYTPCIIPVGGNSYAIDYQGAGSTGKVETLQIANSSSDTYQINAVAGSTTISASVVIKNGSPSVTSWLINRS